MPQESFLARNRGRLLWGLAALALVGIASLAFLNATSPAYACATEWDPAPTSAPGPDATQRLGITQTDLGRDHVSLGAFVKYALCPPATGNHYNATGDGPIRPGVYGPDDQATPQGWIHNLEHGGLVLLYRCGSGDTACSESGQAALNQFNASFPNSPICDIPKGGVGPIVARFDQMKWPYVAMVWGIVLPLDTLDVNQVYAFFAREGERTNPEPLCAKPTATPAPTGTPAPTDTAAPSVDASASPSPAAS
ncbi:MAG: DUF3105 domain-containing protein [Chloroflexota bacterium]